MRRLAVLLAALALAAATDCPSGDKYCYRSFPQIVAELRALESRHPGLIELDSAQRAYGLADAGASCGGEPCRQWFVRLTNEATLPDPERPQVFFSGCLHGNERVGPQVLLELLRYLADGYNSDSDSDSDTRSWIRRLVDTREVVVVPVTNPDGYARNRREDNSVDPNRDFPFVQDPKRCLQSVTAQAINELYRHNAFQLGTTFHAGEESISYVWGSPNHKARGGLDVSPDHSALKQVVGNMRAFAGKFGRQGLYRTGTMSKTVYDVAGGMEDWAYAGSWANALDPLSSGRAPVGSCASKHGYPAAERTQYNDAMLRSVTVLVEASKHKNPPAAQLGGPPGLLDPAGAGNGYLSRLLRAALLQVDVVEPYVAWTAPVSSDTSLPRGAPLPQPVAAEAGAALELHWDVGGGFSVDLTEVLWGRWPDGDGATPPAFDDAWLAADAQVLGHSPVLVGTTRWHSPQHVGEALLAPRFKYGLVLEEPGDYWVVARAQVDQGWTEQGTGAQRPHPDVPPQSHVVNARTNAAWRKENNGHVVRGRLDWLSQALRVRVTAGGGVVAPVPPEAPAPVSNAAPGDPDAAPLEPARPDNAPVTGADSGAGGVETATGTGTGSGSAALRGAPCGTVTTTTTTTVGSSDEAVSTGADVVELVGLVAVGVVVGMWRARRSTSASASK